MKRTLHSTDQLECMDPKLNDFRTTHNQHAYSTPHPPSFNLLQAYSWSLPTVSIDAGLQPSETAQDTATQRSGRATVGVPFVIVVTLRKAG